ncbi:MAG: HK97 family phage prohead protease [Saccharofermentanaceae bacterium]|jgi:hypothetical protein
MSRIKLPELEQKDLFAYLVANKKQLIRQKCMHPIKSDAVSFGVQFIKSGEVVKAMSVDMEEDIIQVKVVGNTALFCDTYNDVLAPDCWKKTIKECGPKGADLISHLACHDHDFEGVIGEPIDIYSEVIDLITLGFDGPGSAQALVMVSNVLKAYDEKAYTLYKRGKVKQHSIGLQYVQLVLALNDENYKEEFATWNKYYKSIINKDKIDVDGYFWYVTEIKLYEISAVLWGANRLTPTLEVTTQPSDDTEKSDIPTDPKPGKLTSDQIKTRILLTKFV